MAEKKIPLRTCIACRQSKPKKELIRIVKSGEEVFVDPTGKANGRGAYICPDKTCFEKLKKSKGLNRAFSCEVKEEVYDALMEKIFGKQ